jgi:hypothetical protein
MLKKDVNGSITRRILPKVGLSKRYIGGVYAGIKEFHAANSPSGTLAISAA